MANNQYLLQLAELKRSYLAEGTINEQFIEIEETIDVDLPYLLEEVTQDHYEIAAKVINIVEGELRKAIPNFNAIGSELERYKESSISVGAQNVTLAIDQMLECLRSGNLTLTGLKIVFNRLKDKTHTFESKIEEFMDIRDHTVPEETIDREYAFDNDDSE